MIADIYIIKRNGKREPFSVDKIRNAISKAFISVGGFASQEAMTNILSRLNIYDGIAVEEIQNQVERSLMAERYYEVAKAYILYRQKHYEDREVKDKMEFLINYCNARNAATGSKYDANANVERKNIATLIGELPKSSFIRLNRRMLCDRIKDVYGKELADKYLYYLNNHFIYKNDETSIANYCASVTMYPWLLNGTQSIGGNASRPTNLKSFCGGFVNMVFMVSSMLSGACATPEFLMYMNYFIELEYGPDYYKEADKVVDLSLKQRTIDKVITDCFGQVLLQEPLRQLPLPRRQRAPLGFAQLAAEAFYALVQQRAYPRRAHLPGGNDGPALQGRRRAGQGVWRLHGRDVCGRALLLHLSQRQCRLFE